MGNHGQPLRSPFIPIATPPPFSTKTGKGDVLSTDCRAIFDYFDNNLGKIVTNPLYPTVLLLDTIDAHVYP